jgi:maltose O-acetyltransferase
VPGSRSRWRRAAYLMFYYGVASRLPANSFPGGDVFRRCRAWACRGFVAAAGEWVNIDAGVFIADGRHLSIGHGSSIGVGSRVYGAAIGEGVMMGAGVTILKDNHALDADGRVLPNRTSSSPPVIGDHSWIGDRVIILPGRMVGANAIVGAGAVVTRDVKDWSVVGGNPARPLDTKRERAPRDGEWSGGPGG